MTGKQGEHSADLMKSLGITVVRLGWMWSGFNPHPGVFNQTYATTLLDIISILNSRGIYVLLDMHQDVMSSDFCLYDGLPKWVVQKSVPRKTFPWPMKGNCSSRGWKINSLTEAAAQAYGDLYDNVGKTATSTGMLDDLAEFWSRSAQLFANVSGIIGYELINEPFAGDFYKDPLVLLPGVAGANNLMKMYDTVAQAIRRHDLNHVIFFEPVTWGMVLNGKIVGSGFDHVPGGDAYRNRSAFSFHYYCATFVPDYSREPKLRKLICDDVVGPLVFEAVKQDLLNFGGSTMMTEGLSCSDAAIAECQVVGTHLDRNLLSWTDYDDSQGETWNPSPTIEKLWSRVHARAVAGVPRSSSFNHSSRDFEFCFTPDANSNSSSSTEIFVGSKYNYPNGATVKCGDGTLLACVPSSIPPAGEGNLSSIDVLLVTRKGGGTVASGVQCVTIKNTY